MNKKFQNSSLELVPTNKEIPVVMPDEVFNKIYRLCQVIPDVEWSGVLLYKTIGSIKDLKNVKIELKDIILMNKGSQTYTSYNFNERKRDQSGFEDTHIDYCEEYEEALGWQIGLIHSHNTMKVFFSSTDDEELIDNAPKHNFYLSLIVNNKMEFEAKIAVYAKAEVSVPLTYKALDEDGVEYEVGKSKTEVKKESVITYNTNILCTRNLELANTDFFTENLLKVISRGNSYSAASEVSSRGIGTSWRNEQNTWSANPTEEVKRNYFNPTQVSQEISIEELSLNFAKSLFTPSNAVYRYKNMSLNLILKRCNKKVLSDIETRFEENIIRELEMSFFEEDYLDVLDKTIEILNTYKESYPFLKGFIKTIQVFYLQIYNK